MALEIEAVPNHQENPQQNNLADPLIYLLSCSEIELGNFELMKLSEIRNLQAHLREVQETIFQLGNQVEIARLMRMRGCDDMRRILETRPPDPTIAAKAAIRRAGLRPGETREREALPPGEAHRNASKKYQATHIANGLCSKCPSPRVRGSKTHCERHLAADSDRKRLKKLLPLAVAS
jgi:hypothetical protein